MVKGELEVVDGVVGWFGEVFDYVDEVFFEDFEFVFDDV